MNRLSLSVLAAGLLWSVGRGGEAFADVDGGPQAAGAMRPLITSIEVEPTEIVVRVEVPAGLRRIMLQSCQHWGEEAWVPRAVQRLDGGAGEVTFRLERSADLALLRVQANPEEPLPASFYEGQSSFSAQRAADGEPVTEGQVAVGLISGFDPVGSLTVTSLPPPPRTPPVDRVFLAGAHWVELEQGRGSSGVELSVTSVDEPTRVLNHLSLTGPSFRGADFHEGYLYVAQGRSAQTFYPWLILLPPGTPNTMAGVIRLTVLDLTQLPAIIVAGVSETETEEAVGSRWEAVWPRPGLLVWHASVSGYSWRSPVISFPARSSGAFVGTTAVKEPVAIFPGPNVWDTGPFFPFPQPLNTSSRWIAFDVSEPAAPLFLSNVSGEQSDGLRTYGRAFGTDDLVLLSHRDLESRIVSTNVYVGTQTVTDIVTNIVTVTNVVSVPVYSFMTNIGWFTNVSTLAVVNRFGEMSGWAGDATLSGVLAAGVYHSLALDREGRAWAWGANWFGQLGDGTKASRSEILPVESVGQLTMMAAGLLHSLALGKDGRVWAWGAGIQPQPTDPLISPVSGLPPLPDPRGSVPVVVPGLDGIVAIAAGDLHSLALGADGMVQAWGANQEGQLGGGTRERRSNPSPVLGLADVRGLAGGGYHSLAVTGDGMVWAWGQNSSGQLGRPEGEGDLFPMPVPGLAGVTAVGAGHSHSLALGVDGRVWAWGRNDSGQLGNGLTEESDQPAPVLGLDSVMAIAAGDAHSLALRADGTVWAWGANSFGQLGDGGHHAQPIPRAILLLSNAVSISAGGSFSLALGVDGTVWGWGENRFGGLGDGEAIRGTTQALWTNVVTEVSYRSVTNYPVQTNYLEVARQVVVTNTWPVQEWLESYYLEVVDYSLPAHPTAREPVSIPGLLEGVSHGGELLYTVGRRTAEEEAEVETEWMDAVSYDGVEAHLVGSLALPNSGPHPVLVRAPTLYVGRSAAGPDSESLLEVWTLEESGRFVRQAGTPLSAPARTVAVFGDLLTVRTSDGLELFDAVVPLAPELIGQGTAEGWLGFDLSKADGSPEHGLRLPLGPYGVFSLKPSPTPSP